MRRLLLTIPVLASLALFCALAAPTANAQESPVYWESLNVLIDIKQNGDLLVQETHVYAFRGQVSPERFRYIDMEKVDQIDRVSVSMEGRELPVETERDGSRFVIRWSHRPINPPENLTFVLRYRVRGAIEMDQDSDLDSVTWEALFGKRRRGAVIERAVVTVRLPWGASPTIQETRELWGCRRFPLARRPHRAVHPPESVPGNRNFIVQLSFPHGLVDVPGPNWRQGFGVFEKIPLTSWFPKVSLSEPTDLIYWGLRFSVIGLIPLLFAASRIRKRRWPQGDYPPEPEGLTEFPSDLPAPVVSVLESRMVNSQTYLSILVDLFQKGNLAITGRSGNEGQTHSLITLEKQSDPNLPWERIVYAQVNPRSTTSKYLKENLEWEEDAIRDRLDEYLVSRGIFNDPPLRVMAEQQMGCMVSLMWLLATILVGLGLGFWVHLIFSPWWAGTAAGVGGPGFWLYCLGGFAGRTHSSHRAWRPGD